MAAMPKFAMPPNVFNGTPPVGTKFILTELWSHAKVIAAFGFAFPGIHQITGSCVWAGGENVVTTVNMVDVIKNNEPEKIIRPFCLYNYGMSRKRAGMRGQGEGSFGSTFAESCTKDGCADGNLPELGLPKPTNSDQIIYGKSIEMQWSDGEKAKTDLRNEAVKRLIKTTTPIKDGAGVRDAILNAYPVTRAFGTFVNPGSQRVKGDVLVGSYDGNGGHQESWLGYWNHPQQGELIFEMNQWGHDVYGVDPGGGAPGGLWIRLEEVDRQCKGQYSEVFAFSQYDGYPAQPDLFDWDKQSFFS